MHTAGQQRGGGHRKNRAVGMEERQQQRGQRAACKQQSGKRQLIVHRPAVNNRGKLECSHPEYRQHHAGKDRGFVSESERIREQ